MGWENDAQKYDERYNNEDIICHEYPELIHRLAVDLRLDYFFC